MKPKTNIFQLLIGALVFIALPILFFFQYDLLSKEFLYTYLLIAIPISIYLVISLLKNPKEKAHPYTTALRLSYFTIILAMVVLVPFTLTDILITAILVVIPFIIPFISKKLTYQMLTLNNKVPLSTQENDWFKNIEISNTPPKNIKLLRAFIFIAISGGAILAHSSTFGISDNFVLLVLKILFSITLFYLVLAVSTEIQKGRYINRNKNK